ncbi:MAG TPA: hypothetical protein PKL92_05050 [Aquaticitalea sp.]|nr:hypothetical protein [Aquaticitalea sp.]HNU59800.1 hypothetical protein [Aquaticitalea sp.]
MLISSVDGEMLNRDFVRKSFTNYLESLGYFCFYIEKIGLEEVKIHNFVIKRSKNWVCIHKKDIQIKKALDRTIMFNAFNPLLGLDTTY